MIHLGVKQDEAGQFYFAQRDGSRLPISAPVELRVTGRLYPKPGEQLIHLEKLNKETGAWTPLHAQFTSSKANTDS